MTPLIFATACIGYIICNFTYILKYRVSRQQNWHILFYSLSIGVIPLFFSYLLNKIVCIFYCMDVSSIDLQIWIVILCIPISLLIVQILNFKFDKEYSLYKSYDNDLDLLLFNSILYGDDEGIMKPIQFTLESRKIYVGLIFDTMEPKNDAPFVTILPIFSGHRGSEKQNLSIDLDYREFFESGIDLLDLQIILPKSKIVSCNYFNEGLYRDINEDV